MKRPAGCLQHHGEPNRNGSNEDHVMAKRQLPSPEALRQLLRYEAKTGKLFWKDRHEASFTETRLWKRWHTLYSGKEAFLMTSRQGYKEANINGVGMKAHRVAWAMHYGEWPSGWIDHINGVRTDNRIDNLRIASGSENAMNRKLPVNSTSGFKGVSWDKESRKWKAHIKRDGVKRSLGRFHCPREAAEAYNAAAIVAFGEFALLNEISGD